MTWKVVHLHLEYCRRYLSTEPRTGLWNPGKQFVQIRIERRVCVLLTVIHSAAAPEICLVEGKCAHFKGIMRSIMENYATVFHESIL